MSINYTYEIVSVDEAARCMEIVYAADGHPTLHIGARLPYAEESVEAIIRMYAPIAYWLEQKRSVLIPTVGATGAINAADEEAQLLAELTVQKPQPISHGAQTL